MSTDICYPRYRREVVPLTPELRQRIISFWSEEIESPWNAVFLLLQFSLIGAAVYLLPGPNAEANIILVGLMGTLRVLSFLKMYRNLSSELRIRTAELDSTLAVYRCTLDLKGPYRWLGHEEGYYLLIPLAAGMTLCRDVSHTPDGLPDGLLEEMRRADKNGSTSSLWTWYDIQPQRDRPIRGEVLIQRGLVPDISGPQIELNLKIFGDDDVDPEELEKFLNLFGEGWVCAEDSIIKIDFETFTEKFDRADSSLKCDTGLQKRG